MSSWNLTAKPRARYDFGTLIGGCWVAEGDEFHTWNPARPEERIGTYSRTSPGAVGLACTQAAAAQAAWRRRSAVERLGIVERFFGAVAQRAEDIALSITREQGKPLTEARGETSKALAEARAMAAHVLRAHGECAAPARPGFRNLITRRPRGVIAAITPWNFPILTPVRKIAPALLFGNAIVLKPSELTPAAACLLADCAREILPPGLLQIVQGGADVGESLIAQPEVAGITFTGSVATGRKIYAAGAANLAELSLELGGKNAAVIHDTPDLEACLDQVAGAAFQCAGQRCTAISRVIVADTLAPAVKAGLVARAERLLLGDGAAEGTTLGPLITEAQLGRVEAMVAAGRRAGAVVLTGGVRPRVPTAPTGFFFAPTILGEVAPTMSVAREEIFGPVISVLTYRHLDEAFAMLNGVDYGLTSALFSNDLGVVQRFIEESQSGMLHVNHGTIPDNHMPFGGIRHSGVGAYSVGPSAAHFYTTEHSVYLKSP